MLNQPVYGYYTFDSNDEGQPLGFGYVYNLVNFGVVVGPKAFPGGPAVTSAEARARFTSTTRRIALSWVRLMTTIRSRWTAPRGERGFTTTAKPPSSFRIAVTFDDTTEYRRDRQQRSRVV